MKKLFSIFLCICAMLYGCSKENNDSGDNPEAPENEEMLAGKTYIWEQGFPYKIGTGIGGWISEDVYLSKYDTLRHSMEIRFIGDMQLSFIETLESSYTSAYRYVPVTDTDELARIPFCYPENWQEFDTICSKTARDTMLAQYSGEYPSIVINLIEHHYTMNSGARPDFDYKFFGWDSSFDYDGTFLSTDTVICTFPYNWNNNVDTITRKFTMIP